MNTIIERVFEKAKSVYGTGLYDDATLVFLFPELQSYQKDGDKYKDEIWKVSPDNKRYEVSSFGRVRNKKRGNIIKHKITLDGYHRVCLSDSGLRNGKSWSVARLVARAFVPNPNELPQVNHIDGNKNNNTPVNLEWVTAKQNIAHGKENGLIRSGDEFSFTVIHKEELVKVYGLKRLGYSYREIGRMYNVGTTTIYHAIKSQRYLKYYDADEFENLVNAYCNEHESNKRS